MQYLLTVHAPAPADEEAALERLRGTFALSKDLSLEELRIHDTEEGIRTFHIEVLLEAPSAYHATQVMAPEVLSRPLLDADVGLDQHEVHYTAERYEPAT